MHQSLSVLLALSWWLCSPLIAAQSNYDKVCGQIEILERQAKAENPSATPVAIPIKATIDCIRNITVGWNRVYDVNLMLLNLDLYLEFETTLESLKNPPSDWPYPPHDLRGELEKVRSKVKKKEYANEYDFEVDLFEKVFAPAHSGHLIFYPDLLVNPWYWSRAVSLVSISQDGSALPEIYLRDDILRDVPEPSRLTKINGIDAQKYVQDLVFRAAPQDPDAGYNAMFYNKAYVAAHISNDGYFAQGGRVNNIYPGENTTYTFANGTEVSVDNVALLRYPDFTGASDNYYFMNRYAGKGYTAQTQVQIPNADPGYPTAIIATQDGTLAGYYLKGAEVDDVAVLSVLSFSPKSVVEYQAVAETFLADAVRDGKKRLVVDLSANNGGYILSGYDLFRQLFPETEQVGLTRFRNNQIQDAAININKKLLPKSFDPKKGNLEEIRAYEKNWNYRIDLDQDGNKFISSEEKFAGHAFSQTNYSSLISWDLNDPYLTTQGPVAFGTEITGYGNRTNFTQPFAAEDIIMLTDGFCASTCFLFSDFMENQGKVKSIAVGGLPNKKSMQAVGGVKGGQVSTWSDLYSKVYQDAFYLWQTQDMNDPDYVFIDKTWLSHREYIGYTATAGVNLRDVIQKNHVEDGLAAQFVREDADCRLFYTKDMIKDVTHVWAKAADVAWNGGQCVAGGLSKRDTFHREEGSDKHKPSDKRSGSLKTKRLIVKEETVEKDAAWRLVHELKAFE